MAYGMLDLRCRMWDVSCNDFGCDMLDVDVDTCLDTVCVGVRIQ